MLSQACINKYKGCHSNLDWDICSFNALLLKPLISFLKQFSFNKEIKIKLEREYCLIYLHSLYHMMPLFVKTTLYKKHTGG